MYSEKGGMRVKRASCYRALDYDIGSSRVFVNDSNLMPVAPLT